SGPRWLTRRPPLSRPTGPRSPAGTGAPERCAAGRGRGGSGSAPCPSRYQHLADLLVREALDVAEHHSGAVLRLERVQCLLDVPVQVVVLVAPLRGAGVGGGGDPLHRRAERVEPDPLLPALTVQEQVGGDPVQPAGERAW